MTTLEEKMESFNKVRALIMKIVRVKPGLTVEEISKRFLMNYGFLPRIDNRLREARQLGWVESRDVEGRLRWYPKETEGTNRPSDSVPDFKREANSLTDKFNEIDKKETV